MKSHIFHKPLTLQIIRLEDRILTAIELKRGNTMPFAKIAVESRGSLHPFPFQPKFRKTMIDEKVISQEFNQLLGRKMVPDISKTNTGRNAAGSSQSAEEGGLGHAETPATLEHIACTIMLRKIEGSVRIIKDPIADSKIKLYSDLDGVCTPAYSLDGIISDALMITVNNGCWSQIRQVLFSHLLTPP
jgi:hypothetical protein